MQLNYQIMGRGVALTKLRTRTGTLLTAASLIASFLGGQALAREGLSVWIVLALIAFGASVVLCIYVLLPKDGLIFALDAPETPASPSRRGNSRDSWRRTRPRQVGPKRGRSFRAKIVGRSVGRVVAVSAAI
jgi:hypothetical protein